jgi:MFS transporter, Spinster family, sphingosine-1-phosphate transporter
MQKRLSPFWTLFILTGLNLFNYIDRYVLAAVLPSLQKSLQINDGDAGRLVTAFMLGYFVTSPIFGYLGDRTSRKWLIAAGIFVWSLGTVLTGFAATFGVMLGYRAMVGVGEASYATISPGWISDAFGREKRNNALTIFYVALPVGAALGNVLGGEIDRFWGWRSSFIVAGAPGLLLALLLLPFGEPKRGEADGKADAPEFLHRPKWEDLFKLFRIPSYLLTVLGYVAYTFALGAFGIWGPSFLHRVHNIPKDAAALFFGIVLVITGLLGTLIGGFAATAWQKRNPAGYAYVLGYSILAAIPTSFLAFLTGNAMLSMAFIAIDSFLLFLSTGPVNTLIIETVPVNLRSGAMAMSIFMIHMFGDVWSPEIVGRLSVHWQSLSKALLILPAALILNAILWLALAVLMSRPARMRNQAPGA